ncbi:MAG: histidine phosphatase family protein [Alphaproteobacteria bacterium]|nr:histidine phosphatase family protein [Alphaproteobacteria bacterium]
MKRHFYFFRHGQTNENKAGATYGNRVEAYLTPDGIAQAEKLGQYLSDKNIEIVYSSPLHRAIETAKIAINNPDIEIITDDRLIETTFGFWYGDGDEIQQRINDNFNRIKSCLDDIVANDTHNNIAIASHGGVTRALCYACGQKIGEIKNGQCFHFVLNNGTWEFVEEFDTGIVVHNKSDMPK